MPCMLCQAPADLLTPVIKLRQAIASDCSPVAHAATVLQCQRCGHYQKLLSSDYQQQVNHIYQRYAPYSLNDGKEQLSFSAQVPFSRCQQILSHCVNLLQLPADARFLDIGTGSGAMLQAVDSLQLGWQKSAQDVSDDKAGLLTRQHQLSAFYAGSIDTISGQFDVVTLIHVLEHIAEPGPFLQALSARLSSTGSAIIQVPDISSNYWDFAIFDHVSHFSPSALFGLLSRYFRQVCFPTQQLAKEITVIVSNSQQRHSQPAAACSGQPHLLFNQQLTLLQQLPDVYVMGTGPAACFCTSVLGDKVLGILDEDPTKIDKYLLGKKIYNANNRCAALVLLPYPPQQIAQIMQRLAQHQYVF